MLRKKWFNPARSLQKNPENMTFAERLVGIYRVFAGRLNQTTAVTSYDLFNNDEPIYSKSKNHAGVYDYLTLGLLNAAESFLRGNWLAAGSTARNVFRAVMAPLWLPLNGLRALVAGVFTLFALPVIAILHNLNKSNLQASIAESKEVATVAAVKTAKLAKIDDSLAKQRDEAINRANHAFEAGSQGFASVAKENADAASAIANSSAALVSKKLNGKSKPENVAVMTEFRERKLHPVKVKLNEVKQALNDKAEVKKAAQDAKASKQAPKPEGFFKRARKKIAQKSVGFIFGR